MSTLGKSIVTTIIVLLLFAAWTGGAFLLGRKSFVLPEPQIKFDTIIIRDTIHNTIPVPEIRYIARMDTVFLSIPGDTVKVEVSVPIEKKVYQTDDYRATIEGFRANLLDIEVYRQTQFITKTEIQRISDKRRWGLGIQAGYGVTATSGKVILRLYVGVGIHYSILTW